MKCLECEGTGVRAPPPEFHDYESERNELEMDAAGVPEFDDDL